MSFSGKERRRYTLLIQHDPDVHPAIFRRAIEAQGINTYVVRPYLGEEFPDPTYMRGIISLGGPMSVNDSVRHPWILKEVDLMKRALDQDLPIAGICLGGQILAQVIGGEIGMNSTPEFGWTSLEITQSGKKDQVFSLEHNPSVYGWHYETFKLPTSGCELLASSVHCSQQAFRVGKNAYGFQFHPEADVQLVGEWLSDPQSRLEIETALKSFPSGGVQPIREQRKKSRKGEKSSLRITTSITQLFRNWEFQSVHPEKHHQLRELHFQRKWVRLQYEGPDRCKHFVTGKIHGFLTTGMGEFSIMRDREGHLWPFRNDHIETLTAVDSPVVADSSSLPSEFWLKSG